jgi:transcriptional regulator with XRE-family HTH domain
MGKIPKINASMDEAVTDGKKPEKLTLARLRKALGWSRDFLAHVMNASDRAIFNWEAGDPISPVFAAKLREIQSVYNELTSLMKPDEIGPWLLTEMDEFEGRTRAKLAASGHPCIISGLECQTDDLQLRIHPGNTFCRSSSAWASVSWLPCHIARSSLSICCVAATMADIS